jgi:hypothetical protein
MSDERRWIPIREYRGTPGAFPWMWFDRGVAGVGPHIDRAILNMEGAIIRPLSGVDLFYFAHVMPVEATPEPPEPRA